MNTKNLSLVFVFGYLLLRMVLDFVFWRGLSPYAAYGFEILFILLGFQFLEKRKFLFKFETKYLTTDLLIPTFAGWTVYRLASFSDLSIPFDLRSVETVFLLLILAPVLEEAIFRGVFWTALKNVCKKPSTILIATTLLFALGHLQAILFVPAAYRIFVLYQTMYVILLGLWAGWRRLEGGALSPAVMVHFGFNLGFFLASFF